MPLDPSIALAVRNPVQLEDPLSQYGKVATIKGMLDASQLNELQRAKLSRDMQEEQAFQSLFANATPDQMQSPDFMSRALAASPSRGMVLQKNLLESKKTQAELEKAQAETKLKNLELTSNIHDRNMQDLQGANDQTSWDAMRSNAYERYASFVGPDKAKQMLANVPPAYSPQAKQQLIATGLKTKDFLDYQLKAANELLQPNGQGGFQENRPLINAKKEVAQAGASNIVVNQDRSFFDKLAGEVGQGIANQAAAAKDAVKTIRSADQIRDALATGKVTAGPGTTLRMAGAQVAAALGFSTDQEGLVQTRQTIQGLAKLALGARAQLKGQGQISDFEGKTLQKAETGDINDLSLPEIKAIADVADKAARFEIQRNSANVAKLRNNPKADKALVDFMDVEEPPAYQSKAPQPQTVTDLPDPAGHAGWTATDPKSGVTYKSDGKRWLRQ